MDTIHSADSTPIAYQRAGTGPPMVLVHGTLGSRRRWPILPILNQHFTVYAMDRRGRGENGDATSYTIAREFGDVAALVNSIGDKVHLLGHSFGGLCALEAALLTPHIRSLVLYEPAPAPPPAGFGSTIDQPQTLLDSGDREGTVIRFLPDVVEMP